MLRWTDASVSRSNYSTAKTHEPTSWASPSTHFQLMDGDAQSEDLGKNGPGNPGLVVPEDPEAMAAPPGT
jgi:hypothetical protein